MHNQNWTALKRITLGYLYDLYEFFRNVSSIFMKTWAYACDGQKRDLVNLRIFHFQYSDNEK